MRTCLGLFVVLALTSGTAQAGEIVLRSGQKLAGELVDQVLVVSTGSGVVEIAPDDVAVVAPDEVRLRDGRAVRGTLVGGRIRARTLYGELTIRVDDLQLFRVAEEAQPGPAPSAASTAPAPVAATPPASPVAPAPPTPAPPPIPAADAASDVGRAPEPAAPPPADARPAPGRGPAAVESGGQRVGQGVSEVTTGVGRTVSDGADRLHDGFRDLGLAIWEGMKSLGRAVEQAFTSD